MSTVYDLTIDEVVDNFSLFDNWEDRYTYLMDLGKKLPAMAEAEKNDETRVKGCQSDVWVKADFSTVDGKEVMRLEGDSASAIVKGLVAIVILLFSGRPRREIPSTDEAVVFGELGLDQYLSPTRKVGLHAMVTRIKSMASGNES